MISWAEQMYLKSTDIRQNLSQCKKMMKSQNHLTQTNEIIFQFRRVNGQQITTRST